MKKFKKWITSPKSTILLFALSAVLLVFTAGGAAYAAFLARSETYTAHMDMNHIGVSLLEKCQGDKTARIVASRDHIENSEDKWEGTVEGKLLQEKSFFGEDDPYIILGKAYPEEISVRNTGGIDEYVRVTITKYWTDPDGKRVFTPAEGSTQKGRTTQGLSPAMIHLHLINDDVWLLDKKATTEERTVLYYKNLLKRGEDTVKTPICDTITIDSSIEEKVSQTWRTRADGTKIIDTVYDYDGWHFCLEAQVDAVQNHNIVDAAKSAWGVDLTVSKDGSIKLAD